MHYKILIKKAICLLQGCLIFKKQVIQTLYCGKTVLKVDGYLFLYWKMKWGRYLHIHPLNVYLFGKQGAVFIPVTENINSITISFCNTWNREVRTVVLEAIQLPVKRNYPFTALQKPLLLQSPSFQSGIPKPVPAAYNFYIQQPCINIQQPAISIQDINFTLLH